MIETYCIYPVCLFICIFVVSSNLIFDMHITLRLKWHQEKKERDLTQFYDKSPYTHRQIQKAPWQHKNATENGLLKQLGQWACHLISICAKILQEVFFVFRLCCQKNYIKEFSSNPHFPRMSLTLYSKTHRSPNFIKHHHSKQNMGRGKISRWKITKHLPENMSNPQVR